MGCLKKKKNTYITTKVASGDSSHVGPSGARDSRTVAIVKVSWFIAENTSMQSGFHSVCSAAPGNDTH